MGKSIRANTIKRNHANKRLLCAPFELMKLQKLNEKLEAIRGISIDKTMNSPSNSSIYHSYFFQYNEVMLENITFSVVVLHFLLDLSGDGVNTPPMEPLVQTPTIKVHIEGETPADVNMKDVTSVPKPKSNIHKTKLHNKKHKKKQKKR